MHVLDCDEGTSNKNLPNVRVRALHTVHNLHALCFEVSLGSLGARACVFGVLYWRML